MLKILAMATVAMAVFCTGPASAWPRHHHHYRHAAPRADIGQPGAYGSSGNMTPGYSSTARHKPTDTNGGGGQ